MVLGRTIQVHDPDAGPTRECGLQPVQELEWVLNLVVHVRENRHVDRIARQLGVTRFPQHEPYSSDPLSVEPRFELFQVLGRDVLGIDRRARAESVRKPNGIVSGPRSDVRDPHSWLDPESVHHPLGFAIAVSDGFFRVERRDDAGDRAVRRRKCVGGSSDYEGKRNDKPDLHYVIGSYMPPGHCRQPHARRRADP